MIKRFYNSHTIFVFVVLILCITACDSRKDKTEKVFIKGVYGDPGTLLEAGYRFDDLGMNAIFVRSYSLNDKLYSAAHEQGCKIFVEFPVLLGKQFLEDNPQCWPIVQAHNTPGEVSPEEFREAMMQGISSPAGGIMMFSDRSLLEDTLKIEVMKELYSGDL